MTLTAAEILDLKTLPLGNADDKDSHHYDPILSARARKLRAMFFDARRALFMSAVDHQGGHSETGRVMAEVLGVKFPLRVPALEERAKAEGFDPAEIWPWLYAMRGRPPAPDPAASCPPCGLVWHTGDGRSLPSRCPRCYRDLVVKSDEAADAALAGGGWERWRGGEAPVPLELTIHARLRNGDEVVGRAREFAWGRHEMSMAEDVVAYRAAV